MTPKTQSVCKHCQYPLKPCFVGHDVSEFCEGFLHFNNYHHCEHKAGSPVAEPASTGEPPRNDQNGPCGVCGSSDPKHDNSHSIPISRPSEPSAALHKSAIEIASERDLKVITEPIDWEAVETDAAPQASAEQKGLCRYCKCGKRVFFDESLNTENWRHFDGGSVACSQSKYDFHWQCPTCDQPAAPQPVSGDAPKEREILQEAIRASLAAYFQIKEVAPDRFRIFIDAGAGEKNLSSHYGIEDATRNRDWLAGRIANRLSHALRPYFPPASQKPNTLLDKNSFLSPLTQTACAISQLSNDSYLKKQIISIAEAEEIIKGYGLATPSSTARTDGWVSVKESLPKHCNLVEVMAIRFNGEVMRDYSFFRDGEWDGVEDQGYRIKPKIVYWHELLRLPAAPGSVPQAPKDECLYGPVGKHIFNPHDDEPRRCVNCGVPQAEPPKEEKP